MPQGSSIPGYVARYGDALRRLNGPQPSVGALGGVMAGRVYDPSMSPGTGALGAEAAQGIDNGMGMAQPTMAAPALQTAPVAPQAPLSGPQPVTPKAGLTQDQRNKRSFWDVAKELSPEERGQITKSFEDKGVDVQGEFNKLQDSGQIPQDPGFVKRNKDGSIDKNDMGMFLLEAGLRQMSAASQPGQNALGAMAQGTLGTIDARRGRAAQAGALAEDQRRYGEARADKADERTIEREKVKATVDTAATKEAGDDRRNESDNKTRLQVANIEAVSRAKAARAAAGKDKETFIDEDDGLVYWKDSGEPVMVKGKDGPKQVKGKTAQDRGEVTERDVMAAGEKQRAALDGNPVSQVTIAGEPVRWSQATDEQKNEYLAGYRKNLQDQSSKKTPTTAAKNVFDQFD